MTDTEAAFILARHAHQIADEIGDMGKRSPYGLLEDARLLISDAAAWRLPEGFVWVDVPPTNPKPGSIYRIRPIAWHERLIEFCRLRDLIPDSQVNPFRKADKAKR